MIQFMRGNSDSVSTNNPVLAAGQPFYELDSHNLKIGDGSTSYSSLPYVKDPNAYPKTGGTISGLVKIVSSENVSMLDLGDDSKVRLSRTSDRTVLSNQSKDGTGMVAITTNSTSGQVIIQTRGNDSGSTSGNFVFTDSALDMRSHPIINCPSIGGSSSCPFPVKSAMIFMDDQDPNTIWPGTTWVRFAEGQTLIGMSSSDTDFNALGKTGGAKSISLAHTHSTSGHALTTSEMPSHTHTMGSHTHTMNHTHSDTFSVASHSHSMSHRHRIRGHNNDNSVHEDGEHSHPIYYRNGTSKVGLDSTGSGGSDYTVTFASGKTVTEGNLRAEEKTSGNFSSAHTHYIDMYSQDYSGSTGSASPSLSGSVSTYSGSTGSASGTSGSSGSGSSHSHGDTGSALSTQSVLQPYVVVAFWQRTA